jgi:hypothetical protein
VQWRKQTVQITNGGNRQSRKPMEGKRREKNKGSRQSREQIEEPAKQGTNGNRAEQETNMDRKAEQGPNGGNRKDRG